MGAVLLRGRSSSSSSDWSMKESSNLHGDSLIAETGLAEDSEFPLKASEKSELSSANSLLDSLLFPLTALVEASVGRGVAAEDSAKRSSC